MSRDNLATTSQKQYIRRLFKNQEYDTNTITKMHTLIGIPQHEVGKTVDSYLDGLDRTGASVLINKLLEDQEED